MPTHDQEHLANPPPMKAGGSPEDCPVAAIGRRLRVVREHLSPLVDMLGRELTNKEERDRDHLIDLEQRLLAEIEWVTPTSAEGACLTLECLRTAAVWDDDDTARWSADRRAMSRLHARLAEYLEEAAGYDLHQVGLGSFAVSHANLTDLARTFAS